MPPTLSHIPRVMVIQETSVQPGRDKLRGIFKYAHLYGPWHVHLVHGRLGEARPGSVRELRAYDGILAGPMMMGLAASLGKMRCPVVLMDPLDAVLQQTPRFRRFCRTCDDSTQVGEAGADYFLSRGYSAFAYVNEFLNRNWSLRRGEAFRKRIRKAGFPCSLYTRPDTLPDAAGDARALAAWLRDLPKPAALLAAMDTRAYQVIELCSQLGIAVPRDVAILGIDDDELLCNGSIPTLSSIRRDTETCGFMAARMLDRLMRRELRKREVFLYGVREIVTRDSTRLPNGPADPFVQRARDFIRINAGTPIGIPDLVRHLNVSRRLIETRFRNACGHSLLDEIQHARLERVERLLRVTDLSLGAICASCGYRTEVHLRRMFKRRFGCPMRTYRARMRHGSSGLHGAPPDATLFPCHANG